MPAAKSGYRYSSENVFAIVWTGKYRLWKQLKIVLLKTS